MGEKIDFCIKTLQNIYGEELSPETKKKVIQLVIEILESELS